MKLFAALFIALISAAPLAAHAEGEGSGPSLIGMFVEPGITYEFSDAKINFPGGDHDGNVHGFGLMGRVGFHIMDIVFVAADGRYSRPTFRDSTGNVDSTANAYNWGAIAGVQTPLAGLRVWAGWILGGGIDPDSVNNFDVKYSSGSGWRVGAGLYIAAVSLNFEYQHIGYDNVEIQQIGAFTPGTNFTGTELTNNSYVFSLSFPVEF
jgi:hypothetical protein